MRPQAMLQPNAPISIVRTSSRPASATLNEPVKVSTMIKPNKLSAMRSCRLSRRLLGVIALPESVQRLVVCVCKGKKALWAGAGPPFFPRHPHHLPLVQRFFEVEPVHERGEGGGPGVSSAGAETFQSFV